MLTTFRKQSLAVCLLIFLIAGCGSTTQRSATEQLLMSDAVDQAIADINFSSLAGRKVYLDTTYLTQIKNAGFVNANYIIGSIRQKMVASHCLLQESKETADVIAEARVGTLGTDGHEITYGVPQTSGLSAAASLISNVPAVPVLPEVSLGRSDSQSAVAKVVLFAYDKETRRPIWQSGISKAESNSQSTWLFGAGPFQKGSVYDGVRFAGTRVKKKKDTAQNSSDIPYFEPYSFDVFDPPQLRVAVNPEEKTDKNESQQKE